MKLKFHIFAVAALGKGLSGSDRIFIEFAKRLSIKQEVHVYVWKEGYEMCRREGLSGVTFHIIEMGSWARHGFLICYLLRILKACWLALWIRLLSDRNTIIYSASEFWMDSFPALILKIRFPKIKWVAAWFQTAPNPLVGFTSGYRIRTYKLSAFYYWFMQLLIKPLISRFADFVLVNNESERNIFPSLNKKKKVIVMLGAIDVIQINRWIRTNSKKIFLKKYDSVFQGRFHPQKGVIELIDIWKLVVRRFPDAKLVMIGDGPLMGEVKRKINELHLHKNIDLLGYVFDGEKKYNVFAQSKIVVHPAFYDSGGMASAEAMAFGLPAVGFNLESYRSYYPKGMVKVEVGNLDKFAVAIIKLLLDKRLCAAKGKEARAMVSKDWDWDKRVEQLLSVFN